MSRQGSNYVERPDAPGDATAGAHIGVGGADAGVGGPLSGGRVWAPKSIKAFNPRPRFNPNRTFNFSDGQRSTGAYTPRGQSVESSPAPEPKKFNPKSMFSPSAASAGVPSGASGSAGGGGGAGPELPIASYSDIVPKFNGLTSEYASLYRPPLHPPQYHLYAPPPFRVRPALDAHQRLAEDLFVSNDLREELHQRNEATLQVLAASSLPEFVHVYHSLIPLDTHVSGTERFGYPTWKYKAVSNTDGRTYCLMRIEGFHLTNEKAMGQINKWKRVVNAGIVGVVEAFTTLAFGDYSMVVVYEYFALSTPLAEAYPGPVREGLLWGLATQLVGAVHSVHKKQLAVRVIDNKRVLLTQKDRVRIGSCGVLDVIDYEKAATGLQPPGYLEKLAETQRQDWKDLGTLLLGLANAKHSWPAVRAAYSASMCHFLETLTSGEGTSETILSLIAPHMWRVLEGCFAQSDKLEETLATELENGRLVRLLSKLEFVVDRPENASSPRWAPTGDRYMLRLFKDYVFHQTDDQGQPSVDLAHVVAALNKLDAGIDEHILLVSGDGQTRIIVSYKELKQAIDQAFRELHAK